MAQDEDNVVELFPDREQSAKVDLVTVPREYLQDLQMKEGIYDNVITSDDPLAAALERIAEVEAENRRLCDRVISTDHDALEMTFHAEGRAALGESKASGLERQLDVTASEVVELKEENRELRTLSTLDGQTGILNKRTYLSHLEKEVVRAYRIGEPLTVIMFDIDHFKKVNDTYGHLAGDALVRAVAQVVGPILRGMDHFARYGGEEFIISAPGTDTYGGRRVAEKARETVQKDAVARAREAYAGELPAEVTISIGLKTYEPGTDGSYEGISLIRAADEALYEAKRGGRNCVRLAGEKHE